MLIFESLHQNDYEIQKVAMRIETFCISLSFWCDDSKISIFFLA